MKLSNKKKAVLALIAANMIWGITPTIMKWSLVDVHVFTLAFLRMIIPALILGIVYHKDIKIKTKHIVLLTAIGLCDITLNIGLYFIGILYTASINVPIIAAASPVFLIIGAVLFLHEKPSKKMLFGYLIGLAGVLLIVVNPLLHNHETSSFFGNILIVFSAIAAVCGTLLTKRLAEQCTTVTITFWSFVVGTISFLPMFLYETLTFGFLPHLTYQGIIGIWYGAIFSSLLAYFLNYWAIRYLMASQTGIFSYLDPIAGVLIAMPLLGEYPTPLFLLGAFLVFLGIYIAEKRINYHPVHKLFEPD